MLPPDGELRVLLVWEAPIDDSDPALKIDSDEVMSSREVAAGRRKRRIRSGRPALPFLPPPYCHPRAAYRTEEALARVDYTRIFGFPSQRSRGE